MPTAQAISPQSLCDFCDTLLFADEFRDYCPNGLQIDAGVPINKIITGVTACQALIDRAIQEKAQAIVVHHGYFWKGEDAAITGMKAKRIKALLEHGISLIAYHLPLDAHPEIGNNRALADMLDLTITGALYPHEKHPVGNIATSKPISSVQLAEKITQALARKPLHICAGSPDRTLQKIALCTGGAQDMIEQAAKMGCDAFISGEISERTTHMARELGVDYFAAGHHATERGGIMRLTTVLAEQFDIGVQFVDIDNPA
ncbi:dinuclear metal center protein, YbgI/SA1388 family [Moraxella cuniculi DSM 21768]|uniref:Dinuclear metal center protein, YbgI/SA1388 family n=1 Tax=Moraxella cuniculi DSM 21768 TaxID=1122245 RepID=A0A1N7EMS7_9GAMM|nr:Nif3-like dinuclear metal center hexameric protein [Moraxella cuniculi]OOS07742.1 Nif3-like dinuclear metal center hexameric protein [Moraxella cuniculi]SIR89377.1 dinuclear metal center protein, YbgI/SA1388 family [Moraxella cuniculi DSM 21768]